MAGDDTDGSGEVRSRPVLLVEDVPSDAELIGDLLEGGGYAVTRVASLREALVALDARPVDVVVLDLGLPDAEGTQGVERIRALTAEPGIVVLTGLDDEGVAMACLAAGAQDFLGKDELRSRNLRRSIEYAHARQSVRRAAARAEALQRRLAAIVEASTDAILSCGPDQRVITWNAAASRIFGRSLAAVKGRPLQTLLGTEASGLFDPERCDEPVELSIRDGSGALRHLSLGVFALHDGNFEDGVAIIAHDLTEARRAAEQLRQRNDTLSQREAQLRALSRRLTSIREEERTRISRTVHDELGQLLTGIKLATRAAQKRLPPDASEVAVKLEEAVSLVDLTHRTVHQIAVELRPSVLDTLGLASAIRDEARRFEQRTGVIHEVSVSVRTEAQDPVATALFRILQELLTNVARHAKAKEVRIGLDERNGRWELVVRDDGVGISQPDPSRQSLGLLGITERAELLGGRFVIARGPSGGTIGRVSIPLAAEGERWD